jgi:hypothetical protein
LNQNENTQIQPIENSNLTRIVGTLKSSLYGNQFLFTLDLESNEADHIFREAGFPQPPPAGPMETKLAQQIYHWVFDQSSIHINSGAPCLPNQLGANFIDGHIQIWGIHQCLIDFKTTFAQDLTWDARFLKKIAPEGGALRVWFEQDGYKRETVLLSDNPSLQLIKYSSWQSALTIPIKALSTPPWSENMKYLQSQTAIIASVILLYLFFGKKSNVSAFLKALATLLLSQTIALLVLVRSLQFGPFQRWSVLVLFVALLLGLGNYLRKFLENPENKKLKKKSWNIPVRLANAGRHGLWISLGVLLALGYLRPISDYSLGRISAFHAWMGVSLGSLIMIAMYLFIFFLMHRAKKHFIRS